MLAPRPGRWRPGRRVLTRGSRPGALVLYVAQAGLGSLQRSTGLAGAPGRPGELPWVISGVVPDGLAGSLLPQENGLGIARAGLRPPAGYAAMAWWWLTWPAAIAGSQRVPWTIRSGPAQQDAARPREPLGEPLPGPSRLVRAACGRPARRVPQHRPGSPPDSQPQRGPAVRREIFVLPQNAGRDWFGPGTSSACLTTGRTRRTGAVAGLSQVAAGWLGSARGSGRSGSSTRSAATRPRASPPAAPACLRSPQRRRRPGAARPAHPRPSRPSPRAVNAPGGSRCPPRPAARRPSCRSSPPPVPCVAAAQPPPGRARRVLGRRAFARSGVGPAGSSLAPGPRLPARSLTQIHPRHRIPRRHQRPQPRLPRVPPPVPPRDPATLTHRTSSCCLGTPSPTLHRRTFPSQRPRQNTSLPLRHLRPITTVKMGRHGSGIDRSGRARDGGEAAGGADRQGPQAGVPGAVSWSG